MTPDDLKRVARMMPESMPHLRQDVLNAADAWEASVNRLLEELADEREAKAADTARLDFIEQEADGGVFLSSDYIGVGRTQRGPIWNCQTRDSMDEPMPHLSGTARDAIDAARGGSK